MASRRFTISAWKALGSVCSAGEVGFTRHSSSVPHAQNLASPLPRGQGLNRRLPHSLDTPPGLPCRSLCLAIRYLQAQRGYQTRALELILGAPLLDEHAFTGWCGRLGHGALKQRAGTTWQREAGRLTAVREVLLAAPKGLRSCSRKEVARGWPRSAEDSDSAPAHARSSASIYGISLYLY